MKKNIIGIVILTTIISGCGSLSMLKSKGIDAVQREAGNQIKEKNEQELEAVREVQEELALEEAKDIESFENMTPSTESKEIDPDLGVIMEEQEEFTIYCDDAKEYSYSYRIYGISGEILEEKKFEFIRSPVLDMITDNIMLIFTSAGPNTNFYTFYDRENDIKSEEFWNVEAIEGRRIAYMGRVGEDEEVCLIIRDMFDKNIYYKEVRRNFEPHEAIEMMLEAAFLDEDKLQIEYRDKDSEALITEIIEL